MRLGRSRPRRADCDRVAGGEHAAELGRLGQGGPHARLERRVGVAHRLGDVVGVDQQRRAGQKRGAGDTPHHRDGRDGAQAIVGIAERPADDSEDGLIEDRGHAGEPARAEHPPVLAAELRGALVADGVRRPRAYSFIFARWLAAQSMYAA